MSGLLIFCSCVCFQNVCPQHVHGWRQWRVVQCCAKRSAGDGTKYRSHIKWRQQNPEK